MEDVKLLKCMREIHVEFSCKCHCCPFNARNTRCKDNLCTFCNIGEYAEEVIEICEKWRKDHPVKTYADVFFEQFPNAERWHNDNRIPQASFNQIYGGTFINSETDVELWLQPYPEDNKNKE